MKYAGADWIEKSLKMEMSDFGRRVADLIGTLTQGIYHVAEEAKRVEWTDPLFIEWRTRWNRFSTTDWHGLTELVQLAHDRCIRVEIMACNSTHIRVLFTSREPWDDRNPSSMSQHPRLSDNIAKIRERQS